jgi:L-fuculose-phosphate aldolase
MARRERTVTFDRERREVCLTCRLLADKGYLSGTGGNVAYRIDNEHFAITPSATDYYAMNPEDICVIRLDNLSQVAGDRKPSVELRLHANVLRVRRDCNASIHTHQPIASAFTLLGRVLEISDPHHAAILGSRAPLLRYAPSGTNWLAMRLRNALRPGISAYLMRNHGVVCCAPTLQDAVARLEALEEACADFFRDVINKRISQGGDPHLTEVLQMLANAGEAEYAQ